MSRPGIVIRGADNKKSIAQKVKRVLKKHKMYKELTLFKDFAPFCGGGRVGRWDMIDLALHYVDVSRKKGNLVIPITFKDIK